MGNRSFRPSPFRPTSKSFGPNLKSFRPNFKAVLFKVICNVFTNYWTKKMSPLQDEDVGDVSKCSFHSPRSLFPTHAMLMMCRLIDSWSYF